MDSLSIITNFIRDNTPYHVTRYGSDNMTSWASLNHTIMITTMPMDSDIDFVQALMSNKAILIWAREVNSRVVIQGTGVPPTNVDLAEPDALDRILEIVRQLDEPA